MFIVIEGIDGTGKTTQTRLLAEALREHTGKDVVTGREPTSLSDSGKLLRAEMAAGRRLGPREEFNAFYEDRVWHNQNVIGPALNAGKSVIVDRYYFSTMAYQSLRGFDAQDTRTFYEKDPLVRKPDLLIVLDMPVKAALKRMEERGEAATAFEQQEILEHCRELYLSLAGEEFVQIISAAHPIEDVHERVLETVMGWHSWISN